MQKKIEYEAKEIINEFYKKEERKIKRQERKENKK